MLCFILFIYFVVLLAPWGLQHTLRCICKGSRWRAEAVESGDKEETVDLDDAEFEALGAENNNNIRVRETTIMPETTTLNPKTKP